MRIVLRVILWVCAVAFIALASSIWWFVYRPLPVLDGTIVLPDLHAQVSVERDNWGIPRIRAASLEDLAEAQGYVVAQDRLWQMDLLRRAAQGRLSEVLGPFTVDVDKEFRTLNFRRAAERDAANLEGEPKLVMDAYARGVNRFIEAHQRTLPIEFSLLGYKPEPWKPSDTLSISAYMYRTLTDTRDVEINRARVTARVGAELAKELYSQDYPGEHYVVGDPGLDARDSEESRADAGEEEDDEPAGEDVLTTSRTMPQAQDAARRTDITSLLAQEATQWLRESGSELRHSLGSNNWVVSGAHTATGKPLLANDTHLELTIAPIWYQIHLTAPGWNVKGFALPGAPMVIIGHNDRIAWGFTNNGADVMDLYAETFNPANPEEYKVNKDWVKADVYDEVIHVKGSADVHLKLVVTRHGPIVATENGHPLAMRWTALEPGGLANTYNWLGKAQNWAEFQEILKKSWGPAQNIVYADVDGNIGYVLGARIPVRKKGHGEVPVPGDTDDYEWTGYIPFDDLPKSFNPESGLIVTANGRVVGPNYKPYLTDNWEEPYRTARIWDLLHDKHDLRPEDMLKVQTDIYSIPHVFLAEQLVAAAKVVPPKDPRARKLIEESGDWNGLADANSPVVSFLNSAMYTSLDLILAAQLGADKDLYDWRRVAFLQRTLMTRPAKWLPPAYKNYDELLSAAADQAVAKLEDRLKDPNPEDWTWKRINYLDMLHPLGQQGALKKLLSITNQPQSGTSYSPRAASRHHGPSERMVANLADWDQTILLITAGQSGQPGSEHYSDQFTYWFQGKAIYAPFSTAAETKVTRHTLTLSPAAAH